MIYGIDFFIYFELIYEDLEDEDIFKYLAKFNCLNENIIEKLIEKQKNNSLMTDILIEIISE